MIGTPFSARLRLSVRGLAAPSTLLSQSPLNRNTSRGYAVAVRLVLDDDCVHVRLAVWQKVVGLLGNVTIPRGNVSDVRVVAEPVAEAMRAGIKVGLRVPWLYYVARTIRLDQIFVVRRGVPGLSFAVSDHGALQRVLVSTHQAHEFAQQLQSG